MANLTAAPGLTPVPQIEVTTPLLGGPGGPLNLQAQALLNRVAKIEGDTGNVLSILAAPTGAAGVGFVQAGTGAVARTVKDKEGDTVSIKDFGAIPDGTTAAQSAIINAVNALVSRGGGVLTINGGGDYLISASIAPAIITADIEIVFEPGARLVAALGLNVPVLDLRASLDTPTDRTLIIRNPAINCEDGDSPPAAQGCSAISAQYFRMFIVENPDLYGGEDPDTANADSGITPIACGSLLVDGGRIRGFGDGGVYCGGDNDAGTAGDGTTGLIRGVQIERCNNAVLSKRDMNHLRVTGCYITECNSGIIGAEITAPSYTGPVRRMDVENNTFKKILANVARFRGPCLGSFNGNTVEDWGYRFDGTNPAGANGYALTIQGAVGMSVKGNTYRLKDFAANDQRAVLLDNVTLNSVLYTQGGHHFADNSYRSVPRGIVEVAGGTGSAYLSEYFEDITTGKFSGLHVDSVVTFREAGKAGVWTRFNGLEYRLGQPAITDSAVSVTLTANDVGGTFTNVGATAEVVYTLPGAAKGSVFEFICMDADGLKVQCTSSDLIRVNGSASTNNGSAKSVTVGTVLRITAIDSTNWVAQSATGTWVLA